MCFFLLNIGLFLVTLLVRELVLAPARGGLQSHTSETANCIKDFPPLISLLNYSNKRRIFNSRHLCQRVTRSVRACRRDIHIHHVYYILHKISLILSICNASGMNAFSFFLHICSILSVLLLYLEHIL